MRQNSNLMGCLAVKGKLSGTIISPPRRQTTISKQFILVIATLVQPTGSELCL